MNILYIAKHGCGGNQDEDAIAYALRKLGHNVIKYMEEQGEMAIGTKADFCLIHKYENMTVLDRIAKTMPVVCWYFDLIRTTDAELKERTLVREQWAAAVYERCALMFCTDGDWVDAVGGRARWLMQGADERYVGRGNPTIERCAPILFTGITYGTRRNAHITHLRARWGDKFQVIGDRNPRQRFHQQRLADLIASTQIVIAPDGPNTDKYWSNRVYLSCGFGAYLLHPSCHRLLHHYSPKQVGYYKDWEGLDQLIEMSLGVDQPTFEARRVISESALVETRHRHLYRHRLESMLQTLVESNVI